MRWNLALPLLLLATGCGSYWDLREGEELAVGCAGQLLWYPDADGDQWGEPGTTGEPGCVPPDGTRTASNALDCDDADPGITGRAGALCPSEMASADGGAACVAGQPQGNSEFVATCAETPPLSPLAARQDCESWAGWDTSQPVGEPVFNRGLASLETDAEYNAIANWLTGLAAGPEALWLDLRWSGDLASGQWAWPDGSLPTYIPPCGGTEPDPADFYPDLVPGLPEADDTLTEHLGEMRLALVFDGSTWCRGVPAIGAPFGELAAHALCERPRPLLADYADAE